MTDCYCDYDMPTLQRHDVLRARKTHCCSDCSGKIYPKEAYQLYVSLYDGTWTKWKRCADCHFIYNEVSRALYDKCGGWCYGEDIAQGLHDEWYNGSINNLDVIKRIIIMYNLSMKTRGGRLCCVSWDDS